MPGENLTRAEARERASVVRTESYEVALDLTTGPTTFTSRTTARFAATPGASTFIDLIAPTVHEVTLNGRALDVAAVFADSRIPLDDLAADNELVVVADAAYMNTGEGLHRFVDPVDDEVYLYSQFEVADSRRVFAVFEQPDLKATFAFTVTAPAHWTVVSNYPQVGAPVAVEDGSNRNGGADKGTATWTFETTPRIASYITAIIAGPYHGEHQELTSSDGRTVPLGVYCRGSLAEHLDTDNILDVTRARVRVLRGDLRGALPVRQVRPAVRPRVQRGRHGERRSRDVPRVLRVPLQGPRGHDRAPRRDDPARARAHVVRRPGDHALVGRPVAQRVVRRVRLDAGHRGGHPVDERVDHVLARSRRTGPTARTSCPRRTRSSRTCATSRTSRSTSTASPTPRARACSSSWSRGSATTSSSPGVRAYFAKHAWGNTELRDLLTELETTSGRDLSAWSALWLEKAGVTLLRPEIAVDDAGVITSFAVLQEVPDEYPVQRPHRLAVGGYDLDAATGRLVRTVHVELDVDGARTEVPALVGVPRPALVLVNDDDLAYAKIRLDPQSLATAIEHLSRVRRLAAPHARVDRRLGRHARRRDARARLRRPGAGQPRARDRLLGAPRAAAAAVDDARPVRRARAPGGLRRRRRRRAARARPRRRRRARTRSCSWSRRSPVGPPPRSQLDAVRDLLDGHATLDGLSIDTDLRWELLTSLVAGGRAGEPDIAAQLAADATATGQRAAAAARAAVPTAEAKATAWSAVIEGDGLPNAIQAATIAGFGRVHDIGLLLPWVAPYFEGLEQIWESKTSEMAQNIVVGLYPTDLAGRHPRRRPRADRRVARGSPRRRAGPAPPGAGVPRRRPPRAGRPGGGPRA